jgi:hypothetical protein
MNRHFVTTRAEFFDFHPIGMVLFIFAAQVVFFTANGAF